MRLIDLDEFLRQNCVDRMEGKTCDECKHHVLEVSCERLMEQPTAERVGKWIATKEWGGRNFSCSECRFEFTVDTCMLKPIWHYCPNCGARLIGEEDETD